MSGLNQKYNGIFCFLNHIISPVFQNGWKMPREFIIVKYELPKISLFTASFEFSEPICIEGNNQKRLKIINSTIGSADLISIKIKLFKIYE